MRGIVEQFIFKDIVTLAMVILFGLPILVWIFYGYRKLFIKSNEAPWQVFIPFYNTFILSDIAKVGWIHALIANSFLIVETLGYYEFELVFFTVSLVGKYIIHYNLCKLYTKDLTYARLMTFVTVPMDALLG